MPDYLDWSYSLLEYSSSAVLLLFLVQVILVIGGKFQELRGAFNLLDLLSPENNLNWSAKTTILTYILDSPIYILVSYALLPFLALITNFWHPPVIYATQVLLEWNIIGPIIVAVISIQMGFIPAGFVYTFLVFSSAENSDRYILLAFLPSFLSSLVYTIAKRHHLATLSR